MNHKDKQNYDDVLHITRKSVMTLLSQTTDANSTGAFLDVIRCVLDGFLDKKGDERGESLVCSPLHVLLASVVAIKPS